MKKINVLSVCGSGTVTSSMIANKVKDILKDKGYSATTVECNPNGVALQLETNNIDLIVYTSPLKQVEYGIPTISAIGLLTGMDEEGFLEDLDNFLEMRG